MKDYRSFFEGKKITLMGLGLLGRGAGDARFLASLGAALTITDIKSEKELAPSLKELAAFPNITYRLGGHRLEDFQHCDMVIKAAGVPLDSSYIAEAKKHGIPVRMSADLFVEFAGITILGVTGTRGK
jgi:UDP-N-acetylmuramoylalanine--D-glutamate ligase